MTEQNCDLCAGKCRGHQLGHPDQWEPEVGSRAWQEANPMTDKTLEVTQEDREAAMMHQHRFLTEGRSETELLWEAFARHRQAAITAACPLIMGWQPIETAPRDGRFLIAARFRDGDELCWAMHSRWITADEIAAYDGGAPDEYDAGWTRGNEDDEPCYPTHWQQLPAPPVTP